ncbi:helix-turn-helix domain-containing protein [Blastococcus sp. TF02A-30]|uniref:helix-turn-helix domain-containing protein n=1 Tax=Blastococcus sp. TF02A-30 TaxID=2250580 RepID=UPI000DE9EF86|nr:helix-turn-helix domain-containing protein [Blastococcus sp. TF02A-30]RBY91008.1 ArsR family transcriptional regulator [Blastococcus sp. TF02A-30]
MPTSDLLLHPVRLRIVQAFLGERTLTTADLHAGLPDVPTASLYRHVATLAEAGVLEVVGERRVRGAAERSYRLVPAAASIGPDAASRMDPEEHRRAFTTFVAALLADFDRYLTRGNVDLARDGVGYRQVGLWLTEDEFAELVADLRAVLAARAANQPAEGRRRRLVSTVHLPGD